MFGILLLINMMFQAYQFCYVRESEWNHNSRHTFYEYKIVITIKSQKKPLSNLKKNWQESFLSVNYIVFAEY